MEWTSINLSSKISLRCGVMLTIIKVLIILFLLCLWEKGTSGNSKNKLVRSPFNWVSKYVLFLAKVKARRRPFLEGARRGGGGGQIMRFHPRVLDCEKRWTISPFLKLEIILPLLCFLLDPLTDKQWRTWSSMINLWIDSRTCQK